MTALKKSAFELGAVVLPASDGLLFELGHDVVALGRDALGVVVEPSSKRSLVHFPELRKSLWLEHEELADVLLCCRQGQEDYCRLIPDADAKACQMSLCWCLSALIEKFPVIAVLEVEHGQMSALLDPTAQARLEGEQIDQELESFRVGLGMTSMSPQKLEEMASFLGKRKILVEYLPAGMHKFEASIFMKRKI